MPHRFQVKVPKWLVFLSLGAAIPPTLTSLWNVMVNGLRWSTPTWLVACGVVFGWGILAGAFSRALILGKFKAMLDRFMFKMDMKVDSLEGNLTQMLQNLQLLVEARLKQDDEDDQRDTEYWLAAIAVLLLTQAISDEPIEKGCCQFCHEKIPTYDDTAPGDATRYLKKYHGTLSNGWPCPAPYMFHLASRRHTQIELRAKSKC